MIKINHKLARELLELNTVGIYTEFFGAYIGKCEFVIFYKKLEVYLAHRSEFKSSGFFAQLKDDTI